MTEDDKREEAIYDVGRDDRNADRTRTHVSCGRLLRGLEDSRQPVQTRVSRLAIAACVLGLLSILGGLTAIPAIILGIVARVVIWKNGGRVTGVGFADIGIVIPVVVIAGLIFKGALQRVGEMSHTIGCMVQLKEIGKAMKIYAHDYDDILPRAGGPNATWGTTIWDAQTRDIAYSDNGTSSQASISSCLYLLVKYIGITPGKFVCKYDQGTSPFELNEETCPLSFKLTDAWDFGSEPMKHCSYSYHMPFSGHALSMSSDPGLAVASERNPWLDTPGAKAKTAAEFGQFIPDTNKFDGDNETAVIGNATTHKGEGQNVLFLDSHVDFARRSFCGLEDDNIFTRSTYSDTGDPKGELPIPSPYLNPANAKDSLLLHDIRVTTAGRWRAR